MIDRGDFCKLEKIVLRAAAKAARVRAAPPQPSREDTTEMTLQQRSIPDTAEETLEPYILGLPSHALLDGEFTDSGHNIIGVLVLCQNVEAIRHPPPPPPPPATRTNRPASV